MIILSSITFIGNVFIIIYRIKNKSDPLTKILKSKTTIKQENIELGERKYTDVLKDNEPQVIPTVEGKDKLN